MDKLDTIKKHIRVYKIILGICLFLIMVSVGVIAYSYAMKSNNKEIVTETKQEEDSNYDKELSLYLDGAVLDVNAIVPELIITKVAQEEEKIPVATVAKADNKEDPARIAKANKGTAKQDSAQNAIQRYETNESSFGIDVSSYQGVIDWAAVKRSGVSFAMIRVGFRGYGSGEIFEDRYFRRNIQGAIANNINVGIYFFSAAKDSAEAREEAIWVANTIKNYDITYPVAIDIEIFNEYRLEGVSNSQMTTNALEFCNYIQGKGYTPMIYSYLKAFNNIFETPRFGNYRVWLAQYNDVATYKGKYYMWQYTSDGTVPGINGRVDMDVAYFSVTNDVTKKSTVTGTDGSSGLESVSFFEADEEVTINKTVTLRTSPYTNAPNRVGELNKGDKVTLRGINDSFIKVIYEGNTFYIDSVNCFDLKEHTFNEYEDRVKTTKNIAALPSPHNIRKDGIAISSGTEIMVLGNDDMYTKIKYNDKIYYVKDLDFYTTITYDNGSGNGGETPVEEPEVEPNPDTPITPEVTEPENPLVSNGEETNEGTE